MSLEDRDWYQEDRVRRMRSQPQPQPQQSSDVDFPALFRQEEARRSAALVLPSRSSSAWGSVLLAGAFVVVLVGLGVWVIKLVRVFS